jgi:transposase
MSSNVLKIFFSEKEIKDEDWDKTPDSIRRAFEWLVQENARLQEQNQQSSRNSSIPPSKDRLQHKKPRRPRCTGRKPGGQPGHPGVTRPLVPPDKVTTTIPVIPESCPCGHIFPDDAPIIGAPYPHQIFDIPPIKPTITEYLLHHRICPDCKAIVRAPRPIGVPALTLGPDAQALVTLLTGKYHLAKRHVSTLMHDVFGIPLSIASICNVEAAVSTVLTTPVEGVRTAVIQAASKNVDESGWAQRRDPDPGQPADSPLKRPWLWSVTTTDATFYLIRRGRNQTVAREILGMQDDATDYPATVTTDRYGVYNILPLSARQLCWQHLDRDFLAVSERADPIAKCIGKELMTQVDTLFHSWHLYRDGVLDFDALGQTMAPVREKVSSLLRGGHQADPKTKTFCNNLLKLEPALWTFLRVEGVEPTNNAAERSQRRGVMKGDHTFGTQSSGGSRYVERILTTVATCQQHGINTLTYLSSALHAYLHDKPIPPLIPP